MKILVISTASVQSSWQEKFVKISVDNSIKIVMLLPNYWIENYNKVYPSIIPNSKIKYVLGKSIWKGYGSRYFFINKLYSILNKFKPDIIHLEQEPWSLIALQTTIYRNLFSPNSKIIFRTSRTFDCKLKFSFFLKYIEKIVFTNAEYAFPLNEKAQLLLRNKGYKGRMKIIPNGVDIKIFKKMDVSKLKKKMQIENTFICGYFGRFIKEKGIDVLISAIALLDIDCKLLLIGDGPYKHELEQIANRENLSDKVIFLETMACENLVQYINCMDIFILASYKIDKWEEFFGRSLIESMACNVPVIGANSGGIPEVIGNAGLIFPELDKYGLAKNILKLHDDKLYRKSVQKEGLKKVLIEYSWDSISNKTVNVYKEILNDNL